MYLFFDWVKNWIVRWLLRSIFWGAFFAGAGIFLGYLGRGDSVKSAAKKTITKIEQRVKGKKEDNKVVQGVAFVREPLRALITGGVALGLFWLFNPLTAPHGVVTLALLVELRVLKWLWGVLDGWLPQEGGGGDAWSGWFFGKEEASIGYQRVANVLYYGTIAVIVFFVGYGVSVDFPVWRKKKNFGANLGARAQTGAGL